MIDAISSAGAGAWPSYDHTPRTGAAGRPAISIYQAPSQRPLDLESASFRTDRLIASLQNLALRARAKEIVEGEPAPAPAPVVTSLASSRAELSVAASAAFRSNAPEYQASVARLVQASVTPPAETEEPPPPAAEEPPPPPPADEPPPPAEEPPPPPPAEEPPPPTYDPGDYNRDGKVDEKDKLYKLLS